MATVLLCGHINRHSLGTNNKPDNLSCTLPSGHSGDHEALHAELIESNRDYNEKGAVVHIDYEERKFLRQWNDMAGIPLEKIQIMPLPEKQLSSFEKAMRGDLG